MYQNNESSKIVQWIIKYSGGTVKDENQANYVLVVSVIVMIVCSFFLLFGVGRNTRHELSPMVWEEIEQMPVNK